MLPLKTVYPLILIDSALKSLQDTNVLIKRDLSNAYHLMRILEDEWKMAFKTPLGNIEYLAMPFRLTNTSIVFLALISDFFK